MVTNMDLDELLASYNEIDRKYRAKFKDSNMDVCRKLIDDDLLSFIPSEEELDSILLEPIRRMSLIN